MACISRASIENLEGIKVAYADSPRESLSGVNPMRGGSFISTRKCILQFCINLSITSHTKDLIEEIYLKYLLMIFRGIESTIPNYVFY